MELEEQLSSHQVSLKHELSLIFPYLSDDVLYDTVLDHRNKNDLSLCSEHLLDHCRDTRHPDDGASPQMCAEDMWNGACSTGDVYKPDWEQHSGLVSDRSHSEDDGQSRRIVLIGKTGTGKSSTGNTMLGKESFKTCFAASSVTEKCQEVRAVRCGQEILLVDTPGVFDTNVPNEQVLQEIAKCISLSLPGPHVFLLVIQAGRFTPEENDTVKHFAKVFGEDVFEHMILVFTGRDALEKRHQSFEEFLQTVPPSLEEIIGKCKKRCIAVDNSPENNSRDIDATKVMEQINMLVEDHHGRHYTNEMYRTAERKCREREEEIRRQKDMEKQKEKDEIKKQLNEEFQIKSDRLEAEKNAQEQKIRDCMKEKQLLEEKLLEKNVKGEEMEIIKRQLRTVEEDAQRYKEQAEDAKHQRQLCLQNRDESIRKRSKDLDCKYENDMKICIANSKPEAVFTMINGAAQLGWGIWQFEKLCYDEME